jgi:hypothetical protein
MQSIRPRLRKILLYLDQLVILKFEHLHKALNGFSFRDRIEYHHQISMTAIIAID